MNNEELRLPPNVAEEYNEQMEQLVNQINGEQEKLIEKFQEIEQPSILEDENDFVEAMTTSTKTIAKKPFQPRNRAERRALDKATRRQKQKKKKMYVDSIKEATTKLAYIDMIQKVRELNEKIKEEGEKENEATN